MYRNNKLLDNKNNSYKFNSQIDLKRNSIYRCYFNKSKNIWEPKDLRLDKKRPNDVEICSLIEKQHKYPIVLNDLKFNYPYYQKQFDYNYFNKHKSSLNAVIENINGNVLDLGCGFKKKMFKNKKGIKNYFGPR